MSRNGASAAVPLLRRRRLPPGVAVAGLVLAGGRGERVGGRDKGLIRSRGRSLAERTAAFLSPWSDLIVVSANRNRRRYARWADVVVADRHPGKPGPLAGISAALAAVDARFVLVCPCDVPMLPAHLPGRLLRALRLDGRADVAVVSDPERVQPLVAAVRGSAGDSIDGYLEGGGRSVHGWLDIVNVAVVTSRVVIGNRND